ncbi:MAG: CDP-glycerol glycerophosphotransferase family protein [Akkermansiaceae bacterium]|nr:CDP-glycerol glycerophosphotransferase family protein [Akkermansiaceae bacterium]MCP5545975.1 CDP-glycerol glycerophosphotransferase family protein [Akkermansiaceae bacterium]
MISRLKTALRSPLPYWQGLARYRLKHWDAADGCFAAALEKSPDHAPSLFKRGMVRWMNKKWMEAFPYVQKAVFLRPGNEIWMTRLRILEDKLETESPPSFLSEEEILVRLEREPDSAFLHSELARCFRLGNKWWLQIDALKAALEIDGNNSGFHSRLGEALEQMHRYREAAAEYERALELADRSAVWHYKAGYALSRIPDAGPAEMERSRAFYQAAIGHPSNQKQQHLGLGYFHQKFSRWQLAADAYEEVARSLDADSSGQALFNLACCHDRNYRWDKAEQGYEAAIQRHDCEAEWHYRLGFVRERQGKHQAAASAYRNAAESAPKLVPAWFYRLGQVLAKEGAYEKACEAFHMSREADAGGAGPDLEWLDDPALNETGERGVEQARDRLARETGRDATDPDAWWKLGNCHEALSQWSEAAEAYNQCVMRTPGHDPARYYRLGACLAKLGRHEEACEAYASLRPIRRAHGLNKSTFQGDSAFRKVAIYTEYYETLAIRPGMALYESFHGETMSCNPYALFLDLLADPSRADWIHVWSVNDPSLVPERFKGMRNVIFVVRGSDAYMRHLASAGVLINNVTFHPYFIRKEGQIYLNTWHGTPWKTVGKHIQGEPFVYGNISRNLLQATHILSPNPHTTDILTRAYEIDGLAHGDIIETGYPRIDLTLNATDAEKEAMRKRLGIDGSRKVVLYAPTWRGSHATPELEADEVEREVNRLKEGDCHLLFRGHTLSDSRGLAHHVPDDISTNDLLSIVDILVTDYSSIWFDFLATGRTILFYLKDLEEYTAARGIYFGIDGLPGPVARNLDDLLAELRNHLRGDVSPAPRIETARLEFCPHEDGRATKRVLERIFAPRSRPLESTEPQVLMFGGKLLPNGITSSLANLLDASAGSPPRITMLAESKWLKETEPEDARRMGRLAAAARILPRVGRANFSHEEMWIQQRFRDDGAIPDSEEIRGIYQHAFAREYRRLLGESRFDAAIDFEGYNTFWTALIGCAPGHLVGHKAIYQHNDMMSECCVRFPYLTQVFELYRHFDRIISVSRMTMDLNNASLSARYGIPDSKFDFVENVLIPSRIRDLAAGEPEGDADIFDGIGPVFITVGRLSIEKDHAKLIRAFAKVAKRNETAKLAIVGDGPLRLQLEGQVRSLGLEERIRFLGFRENPFPYIRKSDCFVLSSNHEGQPMVLLEAIILGKPIIATDIVGSRGVIEGRSGELVENSDAGLARGMREFLKGGIAAAEVDMDAYLTKALQAFRAKSCGLGDAAPR